MPAESGVLARLESLDLSSNLLAGAIPAALAQAASLKVLHLGDNVLGGSLQVELGNLAKLERLHLHDNPLAGALPGSLTRLTAPQHLSYQNTRQCAPGDAAFLSWLGSVPVRQDSGLICGTYTYLVPSMAHLRGSAGTQWRTDLAAVNPGTAAVEMTMTLAFAGAPITRTVVIEAGASAEWRDAVVSLFGRDPGAATSGTVEIVATAAVHVTSRTYNETPTGSYGQYYPACTVKDALSFGQVGVLPQLGKSARVRTNIGILNQGGASCAVRVKLFDQAGLQRGDTRVITAAPGKWRQENDIFARAGAGEVDVAYATVEVDTPGGLVWAYASVVDAATGDPTTVPVLVPY